MRHEESPRVAILVDTSSDWGRRIGRGIIAYAHKHGPWRIWVEPHGQTESLRLPTGWIGEGVIARVSTPALARSLAAARVPVVNVSAIELQGVDLPRVAAGLEAQGRLAAEYFLGLGFRSLAYVGFLRIAYIKHHYQAFDERASKAGASCIAYQPSHSSTASWIAREKDLSRWLQSLPTPVGILTWSSNDGRRVINACRAGGLMVPEQVAVLASGDDEILNEACSPPLSAITAPDEQIGHDAAAVLDGLMRGRRPPKAPLLIEPTGIVARQSTDTLAVEDPELAQAIRFIREHAHQAISVEDVLRAVPVSRRKLEISFRTVLGCSPATEIRRVHLQRARQLLVQTDMPIPQVAAASGFGSREYLSYAFKQDTGLSPLKYRSQIRVR